MANCYAPEADDFHRRWLPREIFADIGIIDTVKPLDAIIAEPEEATDVAELAMQLVGIIGAARCKGKSAPCDPSPPPLAPAIYAPCHFTASVCGLEEAAFMSYGGASIASPVALYSSVMWQVASNYSLLSQPPLSLVSQPCHGTGVFLPRIDAYPRRVSSPAKDGKAPMSRTWVAGRPVLQQQKQKEGEAAGAGRSHKGKAAAVALPEEWSYSRSPRPRVHRGNSQ